MIKLIRRLISMFAIISLCCCAAANASGDSAEEEQLIQILRNKKILSQGKDGEANSVDYYHNLNQQHRDNQKRTTQEK